MSFRNLHVPTFDAATGAVIDSDRDERQLRAYVHTTPARWAAVTAQYQWDKLVRDPQGNNEGLLADVRTHRLAGEGRFFSRSGAFGRVRATFVDQSGHFQNPLQVVEPGADRFWTVDASAGYRLPRQYGSRRSKFVMRSTASSAFRTSARTNRRFCPHDKCWSDSRSLFNSNFDGGCDAEQCVCDHRVGQVRFRGRSTRRRTND